MTVLPFKKQRINRKGKGHRDGKWPYLKRHKPWSVPIVLLLLTEKPGVLSLLFSAPPHNPLVDPWQWWGFILQRLILRNGEPKPTFSPHPPPLSTLWEKNKKKQARCGGLLISWASLLLGEWDTAHNNHWETAVLNPSPLPTPLPPFCKHRTLQALERVVSTVQAHFMDF